MKDYLGIAEIAKFYEKHKSFFQDSYRLNAGAQMWAKPILKRSKSDYLHWRNKYQGFAHWTSQLPEADQKLLSRFSEKLRRILVNSTVMAEDEVSFGDKPENLFEIDDDIIPLNFKYFIYSIEENQVDSFLNLEGTATLCNFLSLNLQKLTPLIEKWNEYQHTKKEAYEAFEALEKKRQSMNLKSDDSMLVERLRFLRDIKNAHGQETFERYLKLLLPVHARSVEEDANQLSSLRARADVLFPEDSLIARFRQFQISEEAGEEAFDTYREQTLNTMMFQLYLAAMLKQKGKLKVTDDVNDFDLIQALARYQKRHTKKYQKYYNIAFKNYNLALHPESNTVQFTISLLSDKVCALDDHAFDAHIKKSILRSIDAADRVMGEEYLSDPRRAISPQDRYVRGVIGVIPIEPQEDIKGIKAQIDQLEAEIQMLNSTTLDHPSTMRETIARISKAYNVLFGLEEGESKRLVSDIIASRKRKFEVQHAQYSGQDDSIKENREFQSELPSNKRRKVIAPKTLKRQSASETSRSPSALKSVAKAALQKEKKRKSIYSSSADNDSPPNEVKRRRIQKRRQ